MMEDILKKEAASLRSKAAAFALAGSLALSTVTFTASCGYKPNEQLVVPHQYLVYFDATAFKAKDDEKAYIDNLIGVLQQLGFEKVQKHNQLPIVTAEYKGKKTYEELNSAISPLKGVKSFEPVLLRKADKISQ